MKLPTVVQQVGAFVVVRAHACSYPFLKIRTMQQPLPPPGLDRVASASRRKDPQGREEVKQMDVRDKRMEDEAKFQKASRPF